MVAMRTRNKTFAGAAYILEATGGLRDGAEGRSGSMPTPADGCGHGTRNHMAEAK